MNNIIFHFLYSLSNTPFIAKAAVFLSYPFTYTVLALLVIWSIFISKNKIFNFTLLSLSVFFSWAVSGILKNILKVNRPFITENIVPIYKETGFSFPSEHTAVFTAVAVAMFLIDKRAGIIFSLVAVLIGLSRIVLGVHYPVDILGGFLVGFIITLIFTEIYKKI